MVTICEVDHKQLVFVRVGDMIIPPSGIIEHLRNYHWIHHPEKGLAFWRSHPKDPDTLLKPWANQSHEITKTMLPMFPWAEVLFVPSVFRKVNPKDYC
jgi:hypothetical protein